MSVKVTTVAGLFNGMRDAKVTQKAKYMSGNVACMVTSVDVINTRINETALIFRCLVILPYEDDKGAPFGQAGYSGLNPGDETSIYIKVSGSEYFLADMKRVLMALFPEASGEELDESDAYLAAGYTEDGTALTGNQPCFGRTFRYYQRGYTNKAGETKFAHEYEPTVPVPELLLSLPANWAERILRNENVVAAAASN